MPTLAPQFLARFERPMTAYMELQLALMRHYLARGGTPEEWCARLSPRFRERYGWMLGG